MAVIYFIIVLLATTAGSMSGMGGGVIIKPVLDLFGHYDVESINMLSCITVLSMAVISILKQLRQRKRPDMRIAVVLALGSVAGGRLGQILLQYLVAGGTSDTLVTLVQNIVLLFTIIFVIVYMLCKERFKPLALTGWPAALGVGLLLGVLSSFLGIGGGPINVALLTYLFAFDTRLATVYSIIIIFFSQLTKLLTVALTTGLASYNLSMLPAMIAAALLGGFLGPAIQSRLSERILDRCFNAVQVVVLLLCAANIIRMI